MHWMFSQCSDSDASPNSSLEITGRTGSGCWSGGKWGRKGSCFYHQRKCGLSEMKNGRGDRQTERERKRERETLAHVLAANGLLLLCMCGWVGAYVLALESDGGLGPGLMRCFRDNAKRGVDM